MNMKSNRQETSTSSESTCTWSFLSVIHRQIWSLLKSKAKIMSAFATWEYDPSCSQSRTIFTYSQCFLTWRTARLLAFSCKANKHNNWIVSRKYMYSEIIFSLLTSAFSKDTSFLSTLIEFEVTFHAIEINEGHCIAFFLQSRWGLSLRQNGRGSPHFR